MPTATILSLNALSAPFYLIRAMNPLCTFAVQQLITLLNPKMKRTIDDALQANDDVAASAMDVECSATSSAKTA